MASKHEYPSESSELLQIARKRNGIIVSKNAIDIAATASGTNCVPSFERDAIVGTTNDQRFD